jgi:hypothetical protein
VVLGEHDRSVVEGNERLVGVETILTHDLFDNYQNDIGETPYLLTTSSNYQNDIGEAPYLLTTSSNYQNDIGETPSIPTASSITIRMTW